MFRGLGMRRGGAPAPFAAGAPQATQGVSQEGTAEELGNRFKVQERLFAWGDDFYVENARGERVFWVDGKALRIRDTLLFKDMQGQERYRIQEKLVRVRETMTLYHADGSTAAQIRKALFTPLRDRYTISVPGRGDLETRGNLLYHEYTIEQDRRPVATISRRWFRLRNTYGVQVAPGTIDPLLAIAVCVAIDAMPGAG
jgi:uncharacterized protein YxjI